MNLQRFEETINGRIYQIEVTAVRPDRWRAYLITLSGTTSLMPFYGTTAPEAAELLVKWLERAHHVASGTLRDDS